MHIFRSMFCERKYDKLMISSPELREFRAKHVAIQIEI